MSAKFELDMSRGPILKNIIRFAVPLMLANMLQLCYNAADIIVVSRFAGSDATASVGASSPIINLLINFFIGISVGGSVVVSRRYGAHDDEGIHRAVHTSMLLGLFVSVLVLIIGEFFAKTFLVYLGTPEGKVLNGAVIYMRIYLIGIPASLIYNFGSAILRAIGDTKRPLYILAISGLINVVLNLIFVIVFGMGVEGVAIATAVSNYVSMILILYALIGADSTYKLTIKELRIYKKELAEILKIGVPAGVHSSVFSLSNVLIQSAVNSFGKAAIAAGTACGNIEGFIYAVKNSFAQATLTSVSQCYGAKDEKRMKKCVRVSLLSMLIGGAALCILVTVFSRQLLGIYITDSAEAIDYGVKRMIITGLPYFVGGIMEVLTAYLRGLGYSSISTMNSIIGVCGFRMFWVFIIFPIYRSYEVLYLCWVISWIIVIIMHTISLKVVKKKAIENMHKACTEENL